MKYNQFKFLFPPRPENAIPAAMLNFYEGRGWMAQYKKNGTNTIIAISPEKEFTAMTRHNAEHKAWALTDHIKQELVRLFPEPEWYVLCAEVMHSKTPNIKDTIYIHDMLVWMSEFMINSTFIERAKLLDSKLITNVEAQSHYVCDSEGKIWYAKRFTEGFLAMFKAIRDVKVDEGLVLKDPDGQLRACRTATENSSWQVKCRHSAKGYAF